MEWAKVKNIMILTLVLTNLLLLILVAVPRAQSNMIEEEGRQSAISLLEKWGISIDERIIPTEIDLSLQFITPDRSDEATLASNLLGSDVTSQDLGGNVFQYSSAMGITRFHSSGEFTAVFEADAIPLGEDTSESHGSTVVSALNINATLTTIARGDDGFSLIYQQLWEGVALQGYGLSLYYHNNCLSQITDAKRLSGTAVVDESITLSVSTALMQFLTQLHQLGDICRTITAITPAYSAATDLAGTVQLNPLWLITTDTGSYQLDLISGTLSRI